MPFSGKIKHTGIHLSKALALAGVLLFFGVVVWDSIHPPIPSQQNPIVFYCSHKHNLKQILLHHLGKAKKSLFITIYGLTDLDVLSLLQKKAQEIEVEVFFDSEGSKQLAKEGTSFFPCAPIRSGGLAHRKIVVIDDRLVLLGSANMTPQSLKMHDNIVVALEHEPLSHFLKYSLENELSFSISGQRAKIHLLPDTDKKALSDILQALHLAKKRICIAMFTFTHPTLIEALIEAHRRGVLVQVALDHYSAKGASQSCKQTLENEGICLKQSQGGKLLHHKWCWIDEEIFLLGSANWTEAAFTKNEDCILWLKDLTPKQNAFISSLWKKIELDAI